MSSADYTSLQQAAEWYATLRAESVSESERLRWRQWLAQSSAHAKAWAHIEAVSKRFDPLRVDGERDAAEAALERARRRRPNRRQVLSGLAALGGVGVLGTVAWRYAPLQLQAWNADYRTSIGELRDVKLADGTEVWLNTSSALNVDYGSELRQLRLLAGEIHITTGSDARRPFMVQVAHGSLRALGTRFTVRAGERDTLLAVYEGAVEIRNSAGSHVVQAGQQTKFTAAAIGDPASADVAREAWVRGIVVADQLPLSELAAELSRYRRGHLQVAPDVAGLRVMGTYPANDPEMALAMLEQSLPVRVRRTLPWWVSIESRN